MDGVWRRGPLALAIATVVLGGCGAQWETSEGTDRIPAPERLANLQLAAPTSASAVRSDMAAPSLTTQPQELGAASREREQAHALQLALDQGQMAQAAALATTPALWQLYSEGQRADAQARITEEETAQLDRESRSERREP